MTFPTYGYPLDVEDYFGAACTWKPGDSTDRLRTVDPTQFIRIDSASGLAEAFNRDDHQTMMNSIDGMNYMDHGIARLGGPIAMRFYPNNGAEFLVGGIGNAAYDAALTADVTTAITTANGLTELVATNAASYRKGAIIKVGSGATQEILPIVNWVSGTKHITVPQTYNTQTGVGTAIQQVAQHNVQPYTRSSGFHRLLRMFCLLDVVGGQYGLIYPGQMVDQFTITANDPAMSLAVEFKGNAPRPDPDTTPVAFDATDTTLADTAFLLQKSLLVLPIDPTQSGTPAQQLVLDAGTWSVQINNNLIERARATRNGVYQYVRGPRDVTVSFTIDQPANYPLFHQRYVATNTAFEFFAFGFLNVGTAGSPTWEAFCIYCPKLQLATSTRVSNGGVIGEQVTGTALAPNSGAYPQSIYLSLLNSKSTVYDSAA